MDESGGHYADWYKPDTERQTLYDLTYMWNLKKSNSEAESRMMVTNGWGEGKNGEILVKGYKVSVMQDE